MTPYHLPKILECMHYAYTTVPGEKVFLRTVKYYEIDINLTGERTMWLDGKRYDVTPGSVVCRTPGQRAYATGTYNMYLLTLDFDFNSGEGLPADGGRTVTDEQISAPQTEAGAYYRKNLPTLFQPAHRTELLAMYERLSAVWRLSDKKQEADDLLAALLHLLLADAFASRLPQAADDTPVSAAVAYLQKNYAQKISLEDLSAIAALNKSYLVRLFKKEMGLTPIEYLNHIRLSAAKEMLEHSAAPLKVIAARCGYDTPAYFVSRFRLAFGLTPEEYRKKSRQNFSLSAYE